MIALKRWQLVTAGVFVVLLLGWAYDEFVKDRIFPKRFEVVVEDALFRSGRIHPDLMPSVLKEYGIDSIVTMTHPVADHPFQIAEKRIAGDLDIPIYRFPLDGNGTGDPQSYIGALERVHEEISNGRQVLVHCAAGTERTGGVVWFYQTLMEGRSYEEAREHLLAVGHKPDRNPDLIPFLDEILPAVTTALTDAGVIERGASPDA